MDGEDRNSPDGRNFNPDDTCDPFSRRDGDDSGARDRNESEDRDVKGDGEEYDADAAAMEELKACIDEADLKFGNCLSVWIRDLITGEKCAVCGRNVTEGKTLICRDCRKAIRGSMLRRCSECGNPRIACACTVPGMADSGCDYLLKLVGYDPADPDYPVNRMIYRLKRRRDRMVHSYLALVMGKSLKRLLDDSDRGGNCGDWIITYVPRSASKIRATGADQAKLFAEALSDATGIPMFPVFRRLPGARSGTQKYLDREEREKNAVASYEIAKLPPDVSVILADDVVTTGATLCECCRCLTEAGVKKIVSVFIAKTEPRRKSRPSETGGKQ